MALPQPVEYKQYSYGVFERKHYMECTTCRRAGLWAPSGGPLRCGEGSRARRGRPSPAAPINAAADGAPLAGGRCVAPLLVEGKHVHVPETRSSSFFRLTVPACCS